LLRGNELSGFTGVQGEIPFFSGRGGVLISGKQRARSVWDGGRGRGACCASGGQAKLRPAAGIARGLDRFRQDQEQKPYHVGHGGVVVGRNLARLAVEFGSTATVMFLTVRMFGFRETS